MVRITIRHISKEGPMEFPVKERRVYTEENITITGCEKIIKRFEEKFPQRRVVRWFRDEIQRRDMEPGGVIVQP